MQRVVPLSMGISLATAGLIAATPAPAATPAAPTVQLTGLDDLITPYGDLAAHTWTNLVGITEDWFADPAPFLHQILANQFGYLHDIFGALFSGDLPGFGQAIVDAGESTWANLLSVLHTASDFTADVDYMTMFDDIDEPSAADVIIALGTGNFHDLLQKTIDSAGNPVLEVGLPIALLVNAIGAPYLAWTALTNGIDDVVDGLRSGDFWGAFVASFTAPAHLIDAYLNGSGASLDILAPFGFDPDDLIGQQFDLGAEPVDVPGLGKGTAYFGDITVLDVGGNLPLGGLLTPLGHADLATTLLYSGGQVVFDERCIPLVGCFTPSPINISSDPDTFDIAREVDGTVFGGLLPALVNWLPEQFADAISPA